MINIEAVFWGKVIVNGREYHQVLLVGDEVWERESARLEDLFGTTHQIGDWERELLLSKNPEVVLIANGWSGVLEVDADLKESAARRGIELKMVLTPKVIEEYCRLAEQGKRINSLIHTTC